MKYTNKDFEDLKKRVEYFEELTNSLSLEIRVLKDKLMIVEFNTCHCKEEENCKGE